MIKAPSRPAQHPDQGSRFGPQLLISTDEALLEAKRLGRSRTVMSPSFADDLRIFVSPTRDAGLHPGLHRGAGSVPLRMRRRLHTVQMRHDDELTAWSAPAVNLAEHADNAIHTDAGAQAAGFPAALVAGVTVYAYMTHVPTAAWGLEWLRAGGAHVRFRSPIFDGEVVNYVPGIDGTVEATVGGSIRSACVVTRLGTHPERCTGTGQELKPISFVADESWETYATRAGDNLTIYDERKILHPVTWMRIANQFFHEQIVTGPWIHVRSSLAHHGVAAHGSTIHATARLIDRFDSRAGERAILDVRISADGQPVATYEHEAIIRVAGGAAEKVADQATDGATTES